jgi:uncharacterized protein (TIGR00290 family)
MSTASRPKAIVSWSSGKDSAFALQEIRTTQACELVGVLTTVTAAFNRVSMHGVREELLDAQIASLGLPCHKIYIPSPCPNSVYESEMGRVLTEAKHNGVTHVLFGDLFLQDIRSYREKQLERLGLHGVFPLWMRDTTRLAHEMLDAGIEATLTCVDLRKLDASFAGKAFDAALLRSLPAGIDPCGENGEFHTFVSAGPMFRAPIPVAVGNVVEREGFAFADLLSATQKLPLCDKPSA